MEVWSLFKYIVILRKRENLISVLLEMRVIYFSIWEAHIDNSKSNKFFYEEFTQGFLASNYAVVHSNRKLTFAKVLYVPILAFIQFNNTPLFMTSVLEEVFKNRNISLLSLYTTNKQSKE